MIRGVIARRHVKLFYSFECRPGLTQRNLEQVENSVQIDPVQLENQRKQVMEIHKQLPQFEYGLDPTEDNYTENLEIRSSITLNDDSQYTGQWDKDNEQRCGRGKLI